MATVIAAHAILNPMLECSVCQEMFKDPRILPCGHTFCLKCLQGIVKTAADKSKSNVKIDTMPCPQCRTQLLVGSQNLQDLPKNFTVADLICSLPANSQCALLGDGDQHGPAQHVCVDCWDALCDTCSKIHTKTKLTRDHSIKLLNEVTTDDIHAHKAKQPVYCEAHSQKTVEFYCETCRRFTCSTCNGVKCKQHNCLEFSDADDKFIAEINTALKPLQDISNKFDCTSRAICLTIKQLSTKFETVQNDIDTLLSDAEIKLQTMFDKLLTTIKQCRTTAKLTVCELYNDQNKKLNSSLVETQNHTHNIKQHVASVQHHLAPSSTVFDRSKFITEKLPDLEKEISCQDKTEVITNLQPDISSWKTDITTWLKNLTDTLTTATTRLPQLSEHSLITHKLLGQATSAKHKCDFVVDEVEDDYFGVSVLPVSSQGQFLVGQLLDELLHVYSAEYSHVKSVNLLEDDKLADAVWTPRGHIVYAACNTKKVVVVTRKGKFVAQTNNLAPSRFYVSPDDVIYLANSETGVYQSTDDGVTWSHVFKAADDWECSQVIKVSSDSNTDTFWTFETLNEDDDCRRLRMYTVDKRRASSNVTSRDITLPSHVTLGSRYTKLAYDGHTNIFVTSNLNCVVHVWSVSGQYVCQLLSSQQFANTRPWCVAVDPRDNHLVYVGQKKGIVSVFELEYKLH